MKHVELIRQRIVRGQAQELRRLRAFISTTDGNVDAIAKMEGDEGMHLLAEVSEFILAKLGHSTKVTADSTEARSRARRVASQVLGSPKGE